MAANPLVADILRKPKGVFLAFDMPDLLKGLSPEPFMLEPPLAHDGKMQAFYLQVLLPFLLQKQSHALLGPTLNATREVKNIEDTFPIHPNTRPSIYVKDDLNLSPLYRL